MKVHLVSDLHTEFYAYDHNVPDADIHLLAGDICHDPNVVLDREWKGKRRIYVPGNHDYYGQDWVQLDNDRKQFYAARDKNLHYVGKKASYIFDGVGFVCTPLWSDCKLNNEEYKKHGLEDHEYLDAVNRGISDFHLVRMNGGLLRARDYRREFEINKRWIRAQIQDMRQKGVNKIVVVTHFVPSRKLMSDFWKGNILNAYFCPSCDDIIDECKPDYWFFGHTHSTVEMKLGSTYCRSNPRGYPREREHPGIKARHGNPHFDPELIIEV